MRRWAYKQMSEPVQPWPGWVWLLIATGGAMLIALKLLGVI